MSDSFQPADFIAPRGEDSAPGEHRVEKLLDAATAALAAINDGGTTRAIGVRPFRLTDFAAAGFVTDRVDWSKAQVLFGVGDLRGIRSVSPVTINDNRPAAFEAAEGVGFEGLSLAAKIDGAADGAKMEFSFEASLQGSERWR